MLASRAVSGRLVQRWNDVSSAMVYEVIGVIREEDAMIPAELNVFYAADPEAEDWIWQAMTDITDEVCRL